MVDLKGWTGSCVQLCSKVFIGRSFQETANDKLISMHNIMCVGIICGTDNMKRIFEVVIFICLV